MVSRANRAATLGAFFCFEHQLTSKKTEKVNHPANVLCPIHSHRKSSVQNELAGGAL